MRDCRVCFDLAVLVFESSGAVSPDPQVSTIPSCDRFNCGRARSQMASKLPRPFTSNCDRPTDRVSSLMSAIGPTWTRRSQLGMSGHWGKAVKNNEIDRVRGSAGEDLRSVRRCNHPPPIFSKDFICWHIQEPRRSGYRKASGQPRTARQAGSGRPSHFGGGLKYRKSGGG